MDAKAIIVFKGEHLEQFAIRLPRQFELAKFKDGARALEKGSNSGPVFAIK